MGSNAWCSSGNGQLRSHGTNDPWNLVNDVLVIAASMIGGFIFAALLTDGNVDDDDDQGGGLMQPVSVPT
tara:strand:+ start:1884 stop:2093 length:210 start_codon:yes stop_codon:yes gene_type:complete